MTISGPSGTQRNANVGKLHSPVSDGPKTVHKSKSGGKVGVLHSIRAAIKNNSFVRFMISAAAAISAVVAFCFTGGEAMLEAASDTANSVADGAKSVGNAAQNMASNVADGVNDAANAVADEAKTAGNTLNQALPDVAKGALTATEAFPDGSIHGPQGEPDPPKTEQTSNDGKLQVKVIKIKPNSGRHQGGPVDSFGFPFLD